MALIKKPEIKNVKMQEKPVELPTDIWKEIAAYAKFVGMRGKAADKYNYIIAEALKNVFESDSAYKTEKAAEKSKSK